uniref:Uncharacterized protein n=2 Tax=Haptolina brevifila TaxID=156173 RepID=A0A7S2CLS9_9EUKA
MTAATDCHQAVSATGCHHAVPATGGYPSSHPPSTGRPHDEVVWLRATLAARDEKIMQLEAEVAEMRRSDRERRVSQLEEMVAELQQKLWVQRRLESNGKGVVQLASAPGEENVQ